MFPLFVLLIFFTFNDARRHHYTSPYGDTADFENSFVNSTYKGHNELKLKDDVTFSFPEKFEWPRTIALDITFFSGVNKSSIITITVEGCELVFRTVEDRDGWLLTTGEFVELFHYPITLSILPENRIIEITKPNADLGCRNKVLRMDWGTDRSQTNIGVEALYVDYFTFRISAQNADVVLLEDD
ncbi:hypothetical protein M3Y94_01019600 [Aphelenchoides besseyi]|nr:hypothetical protein M3Y94_01019600 [Aphelenchoides besseyi]KAI6216840.1 hypothetical protein M3Y95_01251800 [Aphelenchoides besseyi]